MSDYKLKSPRYFLAWGIIALIAIVGVITALSYIFFASQPVPGAFYPRFVFFPFAGLFALFGIFAIFWLVRWLFWPWRWHYPGRYWRYRDESYYILRERYAKGELTKEQFEQMMRDLEQRN